MTTCSADVDHFFPMMLTTPFRANCMFLTGAIERFGTGIPEMYALSAERGLKASDFEDNKTFLVTLWRPSASTAHDTGQVTVQDTVQVTVQVGHLNYLSEPERVVLILESEMSREDLMTLLELKHNAKAIKRRVIEVINSPRKKKYRNKHHVQPSEVL